MTKMQKTIIAIANDAKKNGVNPIEAVREYFDEKGSHMPKERVAAILAIAREAERNEK